MMTSASSLPPRRPAGEVWRSLGRWTKVGVVLSAVWMLLSLVTSGFVGLLFAGGAIALGTAGYTLATGRRSWAMIPSRTAATLTVVGAVVLFSVGGTITSNTTRTSAIAELSTQSDADESAPEVAPRESSQVVSTKEVKVTEAIPFSSITVDDPTLAAGVVQVTTAGIPGARTVTYRVTMIDGREAGKVVIGQVTTLAPVTQVTSNGTYVAPPPVVAPVPFVDTSSGCDGNYTGACVPIDSDVDCAGGSGNGPSYVWGPVYVVGSDIYDLDRDGDGTACD